MTMLTPGGRSPYVQGGRRRRRGLRLLVMLLVLVVLAAAGFGVWYQFFRTDAPTTTATPRCPTAASTTASPASTAPPASAAPPVSTASPATAASPLPSPASITVTVLNTTTTDGLAKGVADALTARGFAIGEVANAPAGTTIPGTAEVRYPPGGEGAAKLVAAQLGPPSSVATVEGTVAGGSVEVLLGTGFTAVNTVEAAQALLSPSPTPVASPSC